MEKIALITGASRGIGAQIAKTFAQNGYTVAVNYNKSVNQAQAICDEIIKFGGKANAYCANIKNAQEVANMVENIEKDFGKINVLVNNAGIAQQKLFTDITEAEFDEMYEVNVKGSFLVTQKVLKNMINQKWGRIINISSVWGEVGASCEVHYSTAKAAIIGFTKALAKEEAPSQITVNCICPGVIETDMLNSFSQQDKEDLRLETPIGRLGTPADIAGIALFLASNEASFITGQIIGVNGGFN